MEKRISLCMVVKDEAKYLGRCLRSVQGSVHEVIVVDTGSTDATREIAEAFGARVKSFAWNDDFSAARNASLEEATGDWILFLDADEELSPAGNQVLQRLTAGAEPEGYEGCFVKIVNHLGSEGQSETCPDLVFRLFRRRPDYRFRGAIHEQIADVILERNPRAKFKVAEGIEIAHYGYLDERVKEKDKKKRNLVLIERELRRAGDDRLLRYHYGVELFRAERYAEAAQELTQAAAGIDPNSIYLPKLLRYVVMSRQNAGQPEQALEAAVLALRFFPDYADLYYYAGLICLDLKSYGRAQEFLEKASSMPEQPAQYASFPGVRGFRCFYHLALLAETYLDEELALKYYLAALQDNSAFTAALEAILRILRPQQEPDYARACLNKIFLLENAQARQKMADVCFRQNAYHLALLYWEEADALNEGTSAHTAPEGTEYWLRRAICLIQDERFLEALKILTVFPPENSLYPLAKVNMLFTYRLVGKVRKVRSALAELRLAGLTEDSAKVLSLLSLPEGEGKFPPDPSRKGGIVPDPDGIELLSQIVCRLLALNRPRLAASILARIEPGTLARQGLNLARMFLAYGFRIKAEYLLQHYLAGKPDGASAEAYFLLGEIYRETDRFAEAEGSYRQALARDPSQPKYWLRLESLYVSHQQELGKLSEQRSVAPS
ncbi:Glycosyltransferase 2-like [Acididesulfobacillus acetoxydans]|uniref:Glycosyl transferase 2 protein n=1 Tax=Acididesulfobacillus acetoxydans TaxID=1561005 RepID=A0A8S0VW19_9FIRM|nr:TPR domain-containing glycosyltransferase [Acididesulfobacillus acetoxydans]CAA7600323.1 Glycosyltransferase 2-like [Acididesulfobacillus acetoxydans]CEJ06099.1 Glycosyl transferase 2 protein [Acididesulfobacillus acetoxydans]